MNFRLAAPGILLAVALPALAVAAPKPAPAPGLVLIETESRIEIDAAGNVVAVRTTPELPAHVAAVVDGNLRKMRFTPGTKDGRAVAGVTYAWQEACAAPEGDASRFAVKFLGNGPSLDRTVVPVYPRDAERRGVTAKWKVTYTIDTLGKGHFVSATRLDDGERAEHDFRASITRWVETMKFQPELVDGQPVATQMTGEVHFVLSGRPTRKDAEAARAGRDACQVALQERAQDHTDVALNSPFKPLPAN
jgi:hypothetical protein